VFKDLRAMKKQAKELQKEQLGGRSGFGAMRDMLKQAPGMMQQGMDQLKQMQAGQAEAQRLLSQGVDATATFVAARETGMAVGAEGFEQPLAELDLDVELPGQPPAQITIRQVVPRLSFGRLVPGAVFPVKVDPMDHSKVVILWDAPPPAASPPGIAQT
jgi:hypothetical protein